MLTLACSRAARAHVLSDPQADFTRLFSDELTASCSFLHPLSLLQIQLRTCHIVSTQGEVAGLNENSPCPHVLSVTCCKTTCRCISGQLLFREQGHLGSRALAAGSKKPAEGFRHGSSLPVLIIGLAFGGIRQQQLSPHGLFPEFKVIGGENAIVLYPAIKTKQNKRKQEQWILNRLSDLMKNRLEY